MMPKQPESHEEIYCGPLETSQAYPKLVTNAVATILVRNNEVVAAVTTETPSRPAAHASGQSERPPAYWQVFALQEDRDPDDSATFPPDFLTLANPIRQDDYFKGIPSGEPFLLVESGQSHWPSINSNSWSSLMIP